MTVPDDAPAGWFKSSHSTQQDCVEVRPGPTVGLRDSKDPDVHFELSPAAFAALIARIKETGEI